MSEKPDKCKTCGRHLVDTPAFDGDPALDCGGDCWGCVGPIEAMLAAELGPIEDHR